MQLSSNFKNEFWSLLQEFYLLKKGCKQRELQVELLKVGDLLHMLKSFIKSNI